MTWCVVVPTCRPDRFLDFISAWNPLFKKHQAVLLIVQDTPEDFVQGGWLKYNHSGIPEWIPRGTDMIRSWGIYKAWQVGAEFTLSLDDDVLPGVDVFEEYEKVFDRGAPVSSYLDVGSFTSYGLPLRGFPYRDRERQEVVLQWGGWNGVLDYDACAQLAHPQPNHDFASVVVPVPKGAAVTGCAMNMAWRTEYAPIMWQLPLHEGRFNRFGDIWSGLFAKKTLDRLGKATVVNGKAVVAHDRASDPLKNLEREAPGIPVNEELWGALHAGFGAEGMLAAYLSVTDSAASFLHKTDPDYAKHFGRARDAWLRLFA